MSSPLPPWPLPPGKLTLAVDEVHVWRTSLQVPEWRFLQLHSTLSPDERERADRYRFLRDQQRFVVARGWLRAVLSKYLPLTAEQVRFHLNPYGKPELGTVARFAQGRLQFNLAHSEDLALCAISYERRVGVDVEQIRSGFADGALAESFFAPREVAALRSLPPPDQEKAFFKCWTRKEAYLKACGEGLITPLDAFAVSCLPHEAPVLLQTLPDPAEATHWSLLELDVGPDYAASLAVEGQGWRLWLWQDPGSVSS